MVIRAGGSQRRVSRFCHGQRRGKGLGGDVLGEFNNEHGHEEHRQVRQRMTSASHSFCSSAKKNPPAIVARLNCLLLGVLNPLLLYRSCRPLSTVSAMCKRVEEQRSASHTKKGVLGDNANCCICLKGIASGVHRTFSASSVPEQQVGV